MNDYKKHKPELRQEFSFSCAYCEIREPELGGAQSFHIDHYKPKKKFPTLTDSVDNLIYSCRNCNQYKGDYWPNTIQKISGKTIFNPRPIGNIKKHINTMIHKWLGKTNSGQWSIEKLRLDSEILVKKRDDRKNIENAIKRLQNLYDLNKHNLIEAIDNGVEQSTIDQINSDMNNLEKEILSISSRIYGPMD